MITEKERRYFQEDFIEMNGLEFIAGAENLLDKFIEWAGDNLDPEDIFDEGELRKWAEDDGMLYPRVAI